jgi:hypothetical protein
MAVTKVAIPSFGSFRVGGERTTLAGIMRLVEQAQTSNLRPNFSNAGETEGKPGEERSLGHAHCCAFRFAAGTVTGASKSLQSLELLRRHDQDHWAPMFGHGH